VQLEGLGEIKAQRSRWFRSQKISVRVGEVLRLEEAETPEELTERLRRGVFDPARDSQ
jgi:hypothetical protein